MNESTIPIAMAGRVIDHRALGRFELPIGEQYAFLTYERTPESLRLLHTEVPKAFRGQGFGRAMVERALEIARLEGRRVIAICPFVRMYVRRADSNRASRTA